MKKALVGFQALLRSYVFYIMLLKDLLKYEESLISSCVNESNISSIDQVSINTIVDNKHREIIASLILLYINKKWSNIDINLVKAKFSFISYISNLPFEISSDEIPDICEKLHVAYLNSNFSIKNGKLTRNKSKSNLIEKGAVYTNQTITEKIVSNTLLPFNKIDKQFSILDFACGTGRFYETIVKNLESIGVKPEESILNNIFAFDLDEIAVNITRLKAIDMLPLVSNEIIDIVCSNIIVRNGLIKKTEKTLEFNGFESADFKGKINNGFDAIVSNPPYLVLKPNKKKLDTEAGQRIMQQVSYFRESGDYKYSIEGMLNLYQLSIEVMLNMMKPNGSLGVICPSTLFADVSATKLRKHLLLSNKVSYIRFFTEDAQLFDNVTQATCIFNLIKGEKTDIISLENNGNLFSVKISLIKKLFPKNFEVPTIKESEWKILSKLSKFTKLKENKNIRNKRGELDLTIYSRFITENQTPYRLIRGNMISRDGVLKDCNHEFVDEAFLSTRSEEYINNDFKKERLICQQISNAKTYKRLVFVFCKPNDILGNSCNYLSSDTKTLKKLKLILNSNILNWRFKVTSSNNHINNYELAELPIVNLSKVDENFIYSSQEELDNYIGKLYGLTKKQIKTITT